MKVKKLRWEILDKKRRAMLPKLAFLRKEYGFYLAGGTALALQIGHRTSIDFDFYCPMDFDPAALYRRLKNRLAHTLSTHRADGTLMVSIEDVGASFFRYEYPLLRPLVRTEHIDLLSLEDIAAMKFIAIVQRGTKRDFVDLYFLMRKFSLETLLKITEKKYSAFNPYIGLRALVYFEDAEEDKSRKQLELFERIGWDRIKKEITEAVSQYNKQQLYSKNL